MPYMPINKCLPVTEDIRLQHRYRGLAADLSRTTSFNKIEIHRLIQMHYMLTTRKKTVMDRQQFAKFMDVFLGLTNTDVLNKIYHIRCRTNKKYMTEREFVELLSLLLMGSLEETIKFCFAVYSEIIRSPVYMKKTDLINMVRRNRSIKTKTSTTDKYDRLFADFVMKVMDKDRDNRISLEDYRMTVNENVAWLQFLGQVLPEPDCAETFMRLFSVRPYVNNIEKSTINQLYYQESTATSRRNTMTTITTDDSSYGSDNASSSLRSDGDGTEFTQDVLDNGPRRPSYIDRLTLF